MRHGNQKKVPSLSATEAKPQFCTVTSQSCDPLAMPDQTQLQAGTSDKIREPFEGMEFETEELAKTFYLKYAKRMGFHARISKYGHSRHDNSIISRHIVCSKEGKLNVNSEGKAKRPRASSRVGCPAMIVIRLANTGKWTVTKFEKEHNHALKPRIKQKNVISEEKKKVLYNKLHEEAKKFVADGSVTEEIYNVAIAALKEASDKVSLAKKNAAEKEVSSELSSSDHSSSETMSSSGGSQQTVATPIKAIPISSRPAKLNGMPVPASAKVPQPTSLVHATAIACGARVVPPNQALSIVKAIEAKIMSGKAIVAKAPVLHKHKPSSGESTRDDHSSNENGEHE